MRRSTGLGRDFVEFVVDVYASLGKSKCAQVDEVFRALNESKINF